MKFKVSPEEAKEMLFEIPFDAKIEKCKLADAIGRILAEDIYACMNVPPFEKSPFDGYAFIASDTEGAGDETPVTLKICEIIPAGYPPGVAITSGYAAKIMTGAPIPPGADAVVKFEDVKFTEDTVTFFSSVSANKNIIQVGEDIKEGECILPKGTKLDAAAMAAISTQGIAEISVYRRPVIGIMNTGTELCPLGEPLKYGQIYSSNYFSISGFLHKAGAKSVDLGIMDDDPERIGEEILKGFETCDVVITSGGASVGDYDWARQVLQNIGSDIFFDKLDIRPGGSMIAGAKDGNVILCLSGNPAAAIIGLQLVVLPYIRKIGGWGNYEPVKLRVKLKEAYKKISNTARPLRGKLEVIDGEAFFVENRNLCVGAVSSLIGCDLLGFLPAGTQPLEAGTLIDAYRI